MCITSILLHPLNFERSNSLNPLNFERSISLSFSKLNTSSSAAYLFPLALSRWPTSTRRYLHPSVSICLTKFLFVNSILSSVCTFLIFTQILPHFMSTNYTLIAVLKHCSTRNSPVNHRCHSVSNHLCTGCTWFLGYFLFIYYPGFIFLNIMDMGIIQRTKSNNDRLSLWEVSIAFAVVIVVVNFFSHWRKFS